jgi:flagellar FliJ protein
MAGKKFRFSLSSVLRVRTHEAERAEQALAQVMQKRTTQERRVDEAMETLRRLQHEPASADQPVTAASLRRAEAHRLDAQRRLNAEEKRLRHVLREEQQARRELTNRRSAEQALVTLHDIEKQRFHQAEAQAENRQIEDQALDLFRRKNAAD